MSILTEFETWKSKTLPPVINEFNQWKRNKPVDLSLPGLSQPTPAISPQTATTRLLTPEESAKQEVEQPEWWRQVKIGGEAGIKTIEDIAGGAQRDIELVFSPLTSMIESGRQVVMGGTPEQAMHAAQRELARPLAQLGLPAEKETMARTEYVEKLPSSKRVPEILKEHKWNDWIADIVGETAELLPYFITPTGVYGAITKGGKTALEVSNLYRKVLTAAIEKGDTYTVRKIAQTLQDARNFARAEMSRLATEKGGFIRLPRQIETKEWWENFRFTPIEKEKFIPITREEANILQTNNITNFRLSDVTVGRKGTLSGEEGWVIPNEPLSVPTLYKRGMALSPKEQTARDLYNSILSRREKRIGASGKVLSKEEIFEELPYKITAERQVGEVMKVSEKPEIVPSEMQKELFEEQKTLFEKPFAKEPEGLQKPVKERVKPEAYNVQKDINIQEGFIMARTDKSLAEIRKMNTSTPENYLKSLKREAERIGVHDKKTMLLPGLSIKEQGYIPTYTNAKLEDIVVDAKLLQPRDVDPIKGVDISRVEEIVGGFDWNKYTPIRVIPHPEIKGKYLLYDGHHRLEAVKMYGAKELPIEIRPLSIADAQEMAITAGVSQKPLHALEAGKKFRIKSDKGMGLEEIKKAYGVEYSIGEMQRNIDLTHLSPSLQEMVKSKAISVPHAGVIGKAAKQNPSIFTPMVQQEIAIEFLGKEKGITPNVLDNLIERLKPAIAEQMDLGFGITEVKGFVKALSELRAGINELTLHQKRLKGFLKVIKEAKKTGAELPTAYVQAAELAEQDIIKLRGRIAEIEREGLKKLAPKPLSEPTTPKPIPEGKPIAGEAEKVWEKEFTRQAQITGMAEKQIPMSPEDIKLWNKDWREFSKKRGYSEQEIKDYQKYLDLVEEGKRFGYTEDDLFAMTIEAQGGQILPVKPPLPPEKPPVRELTERPTIGRQEYYQRTKFLKKEAFTSHQKLLAQPEPLPKPQNIQQLKSEYKRLIANKDYAQAQQMVSEWTGTTKFGKKRVTGYPPGLDLSDIEVVRPKQFLPYAQIEDLAQIEELAFRPKGRIIPTRLWQTMWRTFDEMGTKATEMFLRPMMDAEHQAVMRIKAFIEELDVMKTKLKVNNQFSSKRIGQYAIWQEPDGRAIMEASGITKPPVLTPSETQMYEWGRKQYNSWYHRLNYYRKYMDKKPIKYRHDYFTHMKEMSVLEEMGWSPVFADVDTAITKGIHRNSPSFRFEKARTGGLRQLDFDYYNVLQNYIKSATEHSQLGPTVYKLREMINKPITDIATGKKYLFSEAKPRAFKEINRWLDFVAKQKNPIDSELDFVVNRIIGTLNKNVAFAVLSGNVQSALIQPSVFVSTITAIGPRWTSKGITKYLNEGADFALKNSKVLEGRYFDVTFYEIANLKNLKGRIGKAGLFPLRWLDMQTAVSSWYGSYEKALAEGLKGLDAIRYADDMVIKTQASAARSLLSPIQRSQLGKTATLFQTFVINNWDFLGTQVFSPRLGKLEMAKRITTYLVGSAMANALYEDVLGLYSPFPSPIRAGMRALSKEDVDIWDLVKGVFSEMAQPIPIIGGTVRFGSGVGGAVTDTIGKLFNGKAGVVETGLKLAGMPGVQQIKKSLRGLLEGNDIRDLYAGPNKYRVNLLMALYESLEGLTEEETIKPEEKKSVLQEFKEWKNK